MKHLLYLLFFVGFIQSTAQAVTVVDSQSSKVITVKKDDHGYYFFHSCQYLEGVVSNCHPLNPQNGLMEHHFEPLREILLDKGDAIAIKRARVELLKWGLVATTAAGTVFLTGRMLKRGIIHFHCCGHDHGLWSKVLKYFPKLDAKQTWRYLFKENSWIAPTYLAQMASIVAAHSTTNSYEDRITVYQNLLADILNILNQDNHAGTLHVRSVRSMEFMVYEAARLKQISADVMHEEK